MIEPDLISREAIVAVGETLLTPIIGHKGHPDVAVDLDDFVQIVRMIPVVVRWKWSLPLTPQVR